MVETVYGSHVSTVLGEMPICQKFPDQHLPCLLGKGEEMEHSPGQVIVAPGQAATVVYVITQGAARMVLSSPAKSRALSAIMELLGPGKLYGLVPALDGQPYIAGLEAMTATRTLVVPRGKFLEELEHHPETARELLGQVVSRGAVDPVPAVVCAFSVSWG